MYMHVEHDGPHFSRPMARFDPHRSLLKCLSVFFVPPTQLERAAELLPDLNI